MEDAFVAIVASAREQFPRDAFMSARRGLFSAGRARILNSMPRAQG
jgi:hypothetical protein